jgi:hypothetical protein
MVVQCMVVGSNFLPQGYKFRACCEDMADHGLYLGIYSRVTVDNDVNVKIIVNVKRFRGYQLILGLNSTNPAPPMKTIAWLPFLNTIVNNHEIEKTVVHKSSECMAWCAKTYHRRGCR